MRPLVVAVSCSHAHTFSKANVPTIRLTTGRGVEGDAHFGDKVQHIIHASKNPEAPNRRQVHLIQAELFEEFSSGGFQVRPGDLGENITTRGLDLLAVPTGTILKIGTEAMIELTGLRHPCKQVEAFAKGLSAAMLSYDAMNRLVRKVGVMAVVLKSGTVTSGDAIAVELPTGHQPPLGLV